MAHDTHDASAGRFPTIEDEASASSPWLPLWGALVLLVVLAYLGIALSGGDGPPTEGSAEAQAAPHGAAAGEAH